MQGGEERGQEGGGQVLRTAESKDTVEVGNTDRGGRLTGEHRLAERKREERGEGRGERRGGTEFIVTMAILTHL